MKVVRPTRKNVAGRSTRTLFRAGLALGLFQALVLVAAASLLMFSDGDWVYHFEQYRVVRGFMANPVEMIAVEAIGTLCILIGIFGVVETEGDLLDVVWAGHGPFLIGICLLLLLMRGLFRPWWLVR
jgi:hypothetical protein